MALRSRRSLRRSRRTHANRDLMNWASQATSIASLGKGRGCGSWLQPRCKRLGHLRRWVARAAFYVAHRVSYGKRIRLQPLRQVGSATFLCVSAVSPGLARDGLTAETRSGEKTAAGQLVFVIACNHRSVRGARAASFWVVSLLLCLCTHAAFAQKKPPSKPIDLNAATADQLQQLPGIGPATAKAIVRFREKSGPFQRPEDLLAIHGVSKSRFEKLRPYITVIRPMKKPS